MNIYPYFTDISSHVTHKFFTLRTSARRNALWAKLLGKKTKLAIFPEEAPEKSPNRKFLGVEEIAVHQIIGTVGRQNDFDHQFRPLNKYLRERWVNAYLALERDGCGPILVHKVGGLYYVEDGHHRVSVAQALGIAFIQAKVWEYPSRVKPAKKCGNMECAELCSAKQYITVTE
jgi:ParB-like nuclease domain